VFEYVEKNLLQVLEKSLRGLHPVKVRLFTWQLVNAVCKCHDSRVVHRDVKPENVLVAADGETLKLCDFGFARALPRPDENSYRPETRAARKPTQPMTEYVATRWYRAPELLLGSNAYDESVDLFAVGCLMGEMTDGQPMFPGTSDLDQLRLVQRGLGCVPVEVLVEQSLSASGTSCPKLKKARAAVMHTAGLKWPVHGERPRDRYASKLGDLALDFMEQTLRPDPRARITAKQASHHPYFRGMDGWTPCETRTEVLNPVKTLVPNPEQQIRTNPVPVTYTRHQARDALCEKNGATAAGHETFASPVVEKSAARRSRLDEARDSFKLGKQKTQEVHQVTIITSPSTPEHNSQELHDRRYAQRVRENAKRLLRERETIDAAVKKRETDAKAARDAARLRLDTDAREAREARRLEMEALRTKELRDIELRAVMNDARDAKRREREMQSRESTLRDVLFPIQNESFARHQRFGDIRGPTQEFAPREVAVKRGRRSGTRRVLAEDIFGEESRRRDVSRDLREKHEDYFRQPVLSSRNVGDRARFLVRLERETRAEPANDAASDLAALLLNAPVGGGRRRLDPPKAGRRAAGLGGGDVNDVVSKWSVPPVPSFEERRERLSTGENYGNRKQKQNGNGGHNQHGFARFLREPLPAIASGLSGWR
jgi:serine/threonine protein kinase